MDIIKGYAASANGHSDGVPASDFLSCERKDRLVRRRTISHLWFEETADRLAIRLHSPLINRLHP